MFNHLLFRGRTKNKTKQLGSTIAENKQNKVSKEPKAIQTSAPVDFTS
jgi:hypothetical protein